MIQKLLFASFLLLVITSIKAQNAPFAVEVASFAERPPNGYFGEIKDIYETLDANYIYRYYIDVPSKEEAHSKRQEVQKLGFVNARVIDFAELKESCSIVCEYIVPKKTGKKVVPFDKNRREYQSVEHLRCIFFDFNQVVLREDAKAELDNLAVFIQINPEIYIEILAHTDARGSDFYNNNLSLNRSSVTYDYLAKKGADKKRMSKKGYGESTPIALNELPTGEDSELGRMLNRRVEFRILDLEGNLLDVVDKIRVPEEVQTGEE